MKRYGLRALAMVFSAVALFSMLGFGLSVSELQGIVANELIPEISKAAGIALVDEYAKKPVAELEELAASGLTPGIRLAASLALKQVNGVVMALSSKTAAELKDLALEGDADAADLYYFYQRRTFTEATLRTEVLSAANETLQIAAGKLLAGYWVPGSFNPKTEAELIDLAKNGEGIGLRIAAATTLTTLWISTQPLTIDQTMVEITKITLVYPELAAAYQNYLAFLFAR